MKQYGKMHYWGEMFEDVIDFRPKFMKKRELLKQLKEINEPDPMIHSLRVSEILRKIKEL
jgi:hypothetical protein